MSEYTVISADEVEDVDAGTRVPGEFRPLTEALGCQQVAVTLIRVPPHSDFEQGTGHYHGEQEELYLVTRRDADHALRRRHPEGRRGIGRTRRRADAAVAP